ncbi:MAG: roadblock/LC7 domain-containing protein [Candidatus Lokiarchaeota archaeon]|nr:roadblock/LC7 domain-containing protein [Candidatus Lokiarchaeota archaeon]
MEANLTEYLEYLCSENDEINDLIVVNDEGLPIAMATSNQTSDQTLVSGMCTALNCIGRELIREMLEGKLKRLLVDCSEGVVLIQPLNQQRILVASCSDMAVLSKIDVSSIQRYIITQQNHLVAM